MLRRFRFALLIFATSAVLGAQVREKRVVPLDPQQREGFETRRRAGVAVLVGVGRYPKYSGLGELRYPARDVDLLEKELTAQRYAVVSLKDGDATRAAVLNAIRQAGEVLDPDSGVMIFFFSGHGFAQGPVNYLATYDAAANAMDQSGLALSNVEKALTDAGAKRRVLWVDACRNEPGKGGEGRSFTRFQAAQGTRILLSTKAGRISYEDDELQQGLFSYFLARGLQGDVGRDDGLISFRDLADYVIDAVQTRSLRSGHVQVPYEAGESSGDFLLAKARGGTANPPGPAPTPTAIERASPQVGDVRVNPKDGQRYVWIASGTFQMGCSPDDSECPDKELRLYAKPSRSVTLSKGFWIGQTPVTQGAYKRVRGGTPSHFKGDQRPVESVNWNEANDYCVAVGMRLPTQAEWEYAARAGSTASRYGELDAIAWHRGNSGHHTHDVAQKQPNAWKLYDMLGNVSEWTGGDERVFSRGGSWATDAPSVRVSLREWSGPDGRYDSVGFRCSGENL